MTNDADKALVGRLQARTVKRLTAKDVFALQCLIAALSAHKGEG